MTSELALNSRRFDAFFCGDTLRIRDCCRRSSSYRLFFRRIRRSFGRHSLLFQNLRLLASYSRLSLSSFSLTISSSRLPVHSP